MGGAESRTRGGVVRVVASVRRGHVRAVVTVEDIGACDGIEYNVDMYFRQSSPAQLSSACLWARVASPRWGLSLDGGACDGRRGGVDHPTRASSHVPYLHILPWSPPCPDILSSRHIARAPVASAPQTALRGTADWLEGARAPSLPTSPPGSATPSRGHLELRGVSCGEQASRGVGWEEGFDAGGKGGWDASARHPAAGRPRVRSVMGRGAPVVFSHVPSLLNLATCVAGMGSPNVSSGPHEQLASLTAGWFCGILMMGRRRDCLGTELRFHSNWNTVRATVSNRTRL